MLDFPQISSRWLRRNAPFVGIVWFWALLMFAFLTWKMAIDANPYGHHFALFGHDFTAMMYALSCHTATWSASLMQMLGFEVFARNDDLYLQNGYTVMVIWGCTAVKELYLFLLIMIFYCGPFWAKVWYTPICLAVLYLYNLLRIGLIPWFAGNGYYSFEFWHELFRLSYYGLLFLLWIGWNEHFVTKQFVRIRLKRMFKGTKVIHRFRRRWW
ncbi:MAG: exosortase/archaeosortase family protein [Bacteroidota bacterium]|nr:exosortase/archaeosortase family protein [Bacteroidota bacterium]